MGQIEESGMRFEDFARIHGLIVHSITPGKWIATPTEDHPHKRNGRYKFLGDVGWVHNWATMESPNMWRTDSKEPSILRIPNDDKERRDAAQKAASKSAWILNQTHLTTHSYLIRKGFRDERGNVWEIDGKEILVIPMRIGGKLVGCQMIEEQKRFLSGQRSKGASFVIDAKGVNIFCEGYATGLSIRAAMKAMSVRYTIHVCFSASNLVHIAKGIPGGMVVADHDPVGEKSALETGKPFWLSDTAGEDFNDFHVRVGLFRASQSLKEAYVASSSAV
jgi:putative DNA primase/helicase